MKDSLKLIMFGVLVGLVACVISWASFLALQSCSATNSCFRNALPPLTSIPTLAAATYPAPKVGAEAVASAPRCHIEAAKLIGAWVSAGYSDTKPFTFTDVKGQTCSATFTDDVQQLFVTPNIWYNGSQACTTCHYADVKKAFQNMDLSSYAGILAGSQRKNAEPKGNDILGGGVWEKSLLYQRLYAPNGQTLIGRPAMPFGRSGITPPVPAYGPVIAAGSPGATGVAAAPAATTSGNATESPSATAANTPAATDTVAAVEIARPSNAGGAGLAVTLTGNADTGKQLFTANCALCHNVEGKGGLPNPGSSDGTVPPLNPIDPSLVSADSRVFGYNLDLFLEHGSTPAGTNPTLKMPAWGDDKKLLPQQIADLIAYVMSLNSSQAPTPTPTP